jgi:hypothetical protein
MPITFKPEDATPDIRRHFAEAMAAWLRLEATSIDEFEDRPTEDTGGDYEETRLKEARAQFLPMWIGALDQLMYDFDPLLRRAIWRPGVREIRKAAGVAEDSRGFWLGPPEEDQEQLRVVAGGATDEVTE